MIAQRCLIAGIILDQITGEKSQSWYEVLPLARPTWLPVKREPVKLSLALLCAVPSSSVAPRLTAARCETLIDIQIGGPPSHVNGSEPVAEAMRYVAL